MKKNHTGENVSLFLSALSSGDNKVKYKIGLFQFFLKDDQFVKIKN
jgi:hypothetical protein